ncbi:conjugal transfer protein, partial [Mammaliicoccus sciuri]|uniref:conjugal transfer protein n=1 Tax=Mammaliicoccus sciuri TaxID=1296 RepID=UPI00194F3475
NDSSSFLLLSFSIILPYLIVYLKICKRTDYYMMEDVLPIISQNFIYSELVNPIIQKKEKQYLVKIAVRYLDNETKIENISQYQLTLEKKDNWKIIMNE